MTIIAPKTLQEDMLRTPDVLEPKARDRHQSTLGPRGGLDQLPLSGRQLVFQQW